MSNEITSLPVSIGLHKKKTCRVRRFKPPDRAAVRRICCDTGFMGNPVDPLFSDRELFADFFTRYYTDFEPAHCLVAESDDGDIVGYLITAAAHRGYSLRQAMIVLRSVPRVLWCMVSGRYDRNDRAFLFWLLGKAGRETPRAPKRAAHFHINILPEWRGAAGRKLATAFFKAIPDWGIGLIYGQMQIYETRRSERVFEKFGFHLYDKREVTKFERFGVRGVEVATFVRDFSA